jgi:hypothetical protein
MGFGDIVSAKPKSAIPAIARGFESEITRESTILNIGALDQVAKFSRGLGLAETMSPI